MKYEYNDLSLDYQAYKGTSKKIWMIPEIMWWQRKKNRQIKFMKYSGIEGECPALALGLWHTSPHPQFSLSYCGHILKKTHQPRDIRLKMKVGSAMSGCKTLWCDFALVGNSHWLRLKWYTKKMWGPK